MSAARRGNGSRSRSLSATDLRSRKISAQIQKSRVMPCRLEFGVQALSVFLSLDDFTAKSGEALGLLRLVILKVFARANVVEVIEGGRVVLIQQIQIRTQRGTGGAGAEGRLGNWPIAEPAPIPLIVKTAIQMSIGFIRDSSPR